MLLACDVWICFRYADRAGHSYGPPEPDVKHELYGLLYKTGCPLAEAGQPKDKVTNNLLLDACKPCKLPVTPELSLRLCAIFTWTLTRLMRKADTDVISCESIRSLHLLYFFFFLSYVHVGVSLFPSGTFKNFGFICCNLHISCLAPALYLSGPLSAEVMGSIGALWM